MLGMSMNISIRQSCYQRTQNSTPLVSEQRSNVSHSIAQTDDQEKDIPVRQAEPTHSIAAVSDTQQVINERKSLNEYIAQYCHSLRNIVSESTSVTKSSRSETALSPEELLDSAEKRLLSVDELKEMQQRIQQKTELIINGQIFKLETLPEDTPLFYQFYCLEQGVSIDDKSLGIFRKNCRIEGKRPAIILFNSELISEVVYSQITQLKEEFENVSIVDVSLLLSPYSIHGIAISQSKTRDGQLILRIDGGECTLKDKILGDSKVRNYSSNNDILDVFQSVAMYHCDQVLELAKVKTNSRGCIKLDFDTELIAPIGTIQCVNGIGGLVTDRFIRGNSTENNDVIHSLEFENSLLAVAEPKNRIMAESVCPTPGIFRNFTRAVKKSFKEPASAPAYDVKQVTPSRDGINSLKMLCKLVDREKVADMIDVDQPLNISFDKRTSWRQKVAIPLKSIKADQSRVWGVRSWEKQAPTS